MKFAVFLGLLAVAAARPGIIHDEGPQVEEKFDHAGLIGESEHHHHVQHDHAKSHQSIKFEHFHPVPVFVKKEHAHLLKHPLEKGHNEHNLKLIHPEHVHKHGGGLVLEDHRVDTEHLLHGLHHGGLEHHGGFEHGGFEQGLEHGGAEFGGYEGGEGLKELAEHGYQFAENGEGLKYEGFRGY